MARDNTTVVNVSIARGAAEQHVNYSLTHTVHTYSLYTRRLKNIPDIFDCNLKKD